jgi:hypothetical protein
VYNVYNNGPRMLPWGTPESIGSEGEVSLLCVVTKYLFCKYDFMSCELVMSITYCND